MNKFYIICAVAVIVLLPSVSYAAGETGEFVQKMQLSLKDATVNWYGPLQQAAQRLLMLLAGLSLVWSTIPMILKNADLQEIIAGIIRVILFTGFFSFLIFEAPEIIEIMIKGWVWLAGKATGTTWDVSVWLILERGLQLGDKVWDQGSAWDMSIIIYGIFAVIIVIMYAAIAAYAFFVIAEMYIITAAGVILLGFGGSQWTIDYARRYLTYCMSIGAKMYVLFLVLGAGEQLIGQWAFDMVDSEDPAGILGLIGVLMILVILAKMIPDAMAGIINGTSIGSGTPNIAGIVAASGAAVTAAAGAAYMGASVTKTAAQAANSNLGAGASVGMKAAHMAKDIGSAAVKTATQKLPGGVSLPPGAIPGWGHGIAGNIKAKETLRKAKDTPDPTNGGGGVS